MTTWTLIYWLVGAPIESRVEIPKHSARPACYATLEREITFKLKRLRVARMRARGEYLRYMCVPEWEFVTDE